MKRHGNLFDRICERSNIELAIEKAEKRRKHKKAIAWFEKNRESNIDLLIDNLKNKKHCTSTYTSFLVKEPKEREIFCLPFYPDRILQHAILNILEPVFMEKFTADTYSCIKGRGIHRAVVKLKLALRDIEAPVYYLKIDIEKYYNSVDLHILKTKLRRAIKCHATLDLLDEIIDSHAPGLPIGNYLSQYLSNFFLSELDHWIKEELRVRHYFRYADDMLFLGASKADMWRVLEAVRPRIEALNLRIKPDIRIAPVSAGINFIGYMFYPTHTLLRKSIKQRFKARVRRLMARGIDDLYFKRKTASYYGWCRHCDARNLVRRTLGPKTYLYEKIQPDLRALGSPL
jgi:retron-type reverse transcriptase